MHRSRESFAQTHHAQPDEHEAVMNTSTKLPSHTEMLLLGDTSALHHFYAAIKSVDGERDSPAWCEIRSEDGGTLLIDTRDSSVVSMPHGVVVRKIREDSADIIIKCLKRFKMLDARLRELPRATLQSNRAEE